MKKVIVIGIVAVLLIMAAGQIVPAHNINNFTSQNMNNPPTKPDVTGPTSGDAGTEYTYQVVSTDPDGDRLKYCFDWGDGTSGCTVQDYASGEVASLSHTWDEEGTYEIKFSALDYEHDLTSEETILRVSMPLHHSQKPSLISSYEGTLKVYIVEPTSRWNDNDGEPYHFGFLDFAFDDALNIPFGDTFVEEITWDAYSAGYTDVRENNLMAIAAVFSPLKHEGYANPPSGNPFDAYYIDATAAAHPGETGQNVKNGEYTHTVFCEKGTATWCRFCPAMSNALYAVYESGDYPFYFVSLISDENSIARQRIGEYNLAGYPTGFFDGGRRIVLGGYSSESPYRNAISYCAKQDVHDLELSISVEWQGNGVIQIEVSITNNEIPNTSPEIPTVTGSTSVRPEKEYTYTAVSTDPEGDKILYRFDWGDGTKDFTDLYESGQEATVSHIWEIEGNYNVTVKAIDERGAESEIATLKVSVPLGYSDNPSVKITKPRNGIYLLGFKVLPFIGQIVIGDVTVKTRVSDTVERVEFLLMESCGCGMRVMHVDTSSPFTWEWNTDYNNNEVIDEGMVQLTVKAYDSEGKTAKEAITFLKLG